MQGHGGEKQQLGADTSFLVTGAGTSRHVRAPLGLRGVPRLCSRVSHPVRGSDFIRSFTWSRRAGLSREYKALISAAVGQDGFEGKQRRAEGLGDPPSSVHQAGPR